MGIGFTLNGKPVDVDVDPTTTLSQWLRANSFTGTKEGCAEGDCGACTVLASDVDAAGKPAWRTVNSCIALLPSFAGREVVTVEGLAAGDKLHPAQTAMMNHAGSQCGYCTPGFVMSIAECVADPPYPLPRGLCPRLDGNLCRCTGYRAIREAALEAVAAPAELVTIAKTPRAPALRSFDVNVGGHRVIRPTSVPELLKLRATHPNARILAGATEIGVEVRKKHEAAPMLIALDGVQDLTRITETAEAWTVGGGATLTALEERLESSKAPAAHGIKKMLRVFASRPIRNRATLAGNIATASPIGDMPPVLLALDAEIVAASSKGERTIPIDQFFTGYRKTALAPDEIVKSIVIPKLKAGSRFDTVKVSKRRDLDISIVAAAFRIDVVDGVITHARLAYGGVAPTPVRALKTEKLLESRLDVDDFAAAIAEVEKEFTPIDDVRAGKAYRRGLCGGLLGRFLSGQTSEPHDDVDFASEGLWAPAVKSRALSHDSARGHVTGGALYVDDTAQRRENMLEVWPVTAPYAHARIIRRDATRARAMPGVRAVLMAEDIPGENDVGAVRKDETLLAKEEVMFHGHPVALVVADTLQNARRAAAAVIVDAAPLPAILGIKDAVKAKSFHTEPHVIARGNAEGALGTSTHVLMGEIDIGGQEHFYLETQAAFAELVEDEMQVWSSTQHPSEIQAAVSHVLHMPRNKVTVTQPRMGGGFGGKETQGNTWAALVALAALHTKRPVRVQLDRDVDMQLTGKRHPFFARYSAGFDGEGRVRALDVSLVSDGGWALDLSESILDRALFHLDNCYHFENVRFEGRVAKTHVVSHTAFRGFGGPQGMLVVEDVLGRVAGHLGIAPEIVRQRNFYAATGQQTPYGQLVDDHRAPRMWTELSFSAELGSRRVEIAAFNAASANVKRGLAMTPVKFGISFTASFLNQAGALVVIYRDGTVQVNHGGTEMGQGLHAKILGIVMRELGVVAESVRVMRTQTDKVPNTSATAASAGADLNGAAVKKACEELRGRLQMVAAGMLEKRLGDAVAAHTVGFINGYALATGSIGAAVNISFADVVEAAYQAQVSLAATGFYRTPDLAYDKKMGRGKPFHYFAYGVAAAEVELDGHTGMKRVRRVDILHDVGDSLNPQIDRGQIEGGFIQGMGWLTGEELKWDASGKLLTHSASTYQIPTLSDAPAVFKVRLLPDAPQTNVVHGSKAVGEPPLMLALSVREALRDAVAAFGGTGEVILPTPLTHEALWHAVQERRARAHKRAAE